MNIPIIARSFAGIADAVVAMGYSLSDAIAWNRAPMRVNGIWRAEVRNERTNEVRPDLQPGLSGDHRDDGGVM